MAGPMNQTNHHVGKIKRLLMLNTSPYHIVVKAKRKRLRATLMTYTRTWTIELARPNQSMDQGGVPQRKMTTIKPGATGIILLGPKTEYGCHPNSVVTLPDTEAPHTPYASPMR